MDTNNNIMYHTCLNDCKRDLTKREIIDILVIILDRISVNMTDKHNLDLYIIIFFKYLFKLSNDYLEVYNTIFAHYTSEYQNSVFNFFIQREIQIKLEAL